jgi:hypothetical protein
MKEVLDVLVMVLCVILLTTLTALMVRMLCIEFGWVKKK